MERKEGSGPYLYNATCAQAAFLTDTVRPERYKPCIAHLADPYLLIRALYAFSTTSTSLSAVDRA